MTDTHSFNDERVPQPGDIVLYGRSSDGKGGISEVPAIILEVHTPGNMESRVDLKTFEMSHDMEVRREVRFVAEPKQGCWRWRPGR